MKNIIVGTSGHIDHGKTTLIKALTGRETDTLKEEKKRGISINLGFTFFDLPSGKRAGIIDVPGHEKFIKNMLAGVSAIDVVLLIVAADEGIMPQTKEHLDILELLNIQKGIVVITKKDLVDDEWYDMIKDDVSKYLNNTFLKDAPIIGISSKNGEGIDELTNTIDDITDVVNQKDSEGHFRLSVDRSFSISGFGTIVTGTVLSGRVQNGETVEVLPNGITSKIRNIQVHENNVEYAEAGQRCALNLSNIKKEEVKRGDVVCTKDVIIPSFMIDVKFKYLKSLKKSLENRQRVKVYHGTKEIVGRIVLLDKEKLKAGEEVYVQLRLEEEICCQRGDRIIVRNYSPMITLGGGVILNPTAIKAKRFNVDYIERLKLREAGNIEDIVLDTILKISSEFPGKNEIIKTLGRNQENLDDLLIDLEKHKKIQHLKETDKFIHNRFFIEKAEEIEKILKNYHEEYPLKSGINKEELRSKVFSNKLKQKVFQELLNLLEQRNLIDQGRNTINLKGFNVKLTKNQQRIKEILIKSFRSGEFMPPKFEDLVAYEKDKKSWKMVYDLLIEQGEFIKIQEDIVYHEYFINSAKNRIINHIKEHEYIKLSDAKELLKGASRKYLVAIMEYMDNEKITKREEDKRVLF